MIKESYLAYVAQQAMLSEYQLEEFKRVSSPDFLKYFSDEAIADREEALIALLEIKWRTAEFFIEDLNSFKGS